MLQSVYYDVAQTGLKPPSQMTELYIPLWVYSSGNVNSSSPTTSGSAFAQKGNSTAATSITSATKLHPLSSNWSSSQKFAFEASVYSDNVNSTAYFALWDTTTSTMVGASQISTTATTATVLRSGQFTLTPGHQYGVTLWKSGSYVGYLTKAHLVAMMS